MQQFFTSVEQMIGNTPLVRLDKIKEKYALHANLFAKIEGQNPAGSIKDRASLYMILDAEKKGLLKPQGTIIEATSGNTGIGLCMVGARKNYKVIIVMPENMSKERILMMKAYGAEVVLTPAQLGMQGAIDKASDLQKTHPNSVILGQFTNAQNVQAHYMTTGRELYTQMQGQIDFFFSAIGTGGTITGISKYLKEQNAHIKTIGIEPFSSPFLTAQKKGAHKIQGIGAGFMPPLLDMRLIDEIHTVKDEEAYICAQTCAQTEGIFIGISSGAALSAGISFAQKKENEGKNMLLIFPDSGSRYLSTPDFILE